MRAHATIYETAEWIQDTRYKYGKKLGEYQIEHAADRQAITEHICRYVEQHYPNSEHTHIEFTKVE